MLLLNWYKSHVSDGQGEKGGGNFRSSCNPLLQRAVEVEMAFSWSKGAQRLLSSSPRHSSATSGGAEGSQGTSAPSVDGSFSSVGVSGLPCGWEKMLGTYSRCHGCMGVWGARQMIAKIGFWLPLCLISRVNGFHGHQPAQKHGIILSFSFTVPCLGSMWDHRGS